MRMTRGSYGSDEQRFWLVAKIPRAVWDECWATAKRKARTLIHGDPSVFLLKFAPEKVSDPQLNAYCPRGGNSGNHGRGYQRPRPSGQGHNPDTAQYMSNVQNLLWCDS